MISALKESSKNATGTVKAQNEATIKNMESFLDLLKSQNNLNKAAQNVQRGEALFNDLSNKANMPVGRANALTDAQISALNSKMSSVQNVINGNKNFLRLSNAKLAATQVLKQNGLGIAAYHLSGAAPRTLNDQYAQMYGFGSLAEMEAYAAQNGVSAEQLADYIDSQCAAQGLTPSQLTNAQATAAAENQALAEQAALQEQQAQQQAQQSAYNMYQNPYMQNPYLMNMINTPTLDFNSLYVSPYPNMF